MRRSHLSRGFSLVEALVSIGIASLTILLLSGGVWGLRLMSEERLAFQDTPADWMAARRVLQAWSAGLTTTGEGGADGRFEGSADRAQMIIEPYATSSTRMFVGDLRVSVDDGIYTLTATRHHGINDTRFDGERPQSSTVLRSEQPIRLLYLLSARTGAGTIWRYDVQTGDGLPIAIGVERGSDRILTAPIMNSVSATCVNVLGVSGLTNERCALR